MNAPRLDPVEAPRVREPACNELVALEERTLDAVSDRLGAVRIHAHSRIAGGFVKRGVRRDDARNAGSHCLDDRNAEPFEARGIDEDLRPAVEVRKLVVRKEAEPGAAWPDEDEVAAEQLDGTLESADVLAPVVRRRREHVGRGK